MSASTDEILQEAGMRRSNDESRLDLYRRCTDAYDGSLAGNQRGVRAMDGAGRTIERAEELRNSLRSRVGAPNLLQPLVDDFVSLKGQVPVMNVVPEDDSLDAKETGVKRSRILRAQWQNSKMVLQQRQAAWHLSALGDACYVLDPLFPTGKKDDPTFEGGLKPPGVYMTVVDPNMAFPKFRTGVDRSELEDLVLNWTTQASLALARWPQLRVADDNSEVDVVQYYDRYCKVTIANGQEVERTEHDLGFCPAQWIGNKATNRHNQSDISQILDLHEEFQVMALVADDSLILSTYPLTWIENPLAFNDQLPMGPGAVIPIGEGGKIGQLAPAAHPGAALELMQTAVQQMEQMAGSAPVRVSNSIDHSNISSRAVHAVQGPMESRLGSFQDGLGHAFQMLNAKLLLMLYKLPEFSKHPMSIFVVDKRGRANIDFTGDELDGWWRTEIEWDTSPGNKHERIVMALQLLGQKIVPRSYVAEQAGIIDADMSIKEADAESDADMQKQMAMQQGIAPGGPPPQGGPPGPSPDVSGPPGLPPVMGQADQANALLGGATQPTLPVAPDVQGAAGVPTAGAQPGILAPYPPVDTPPNQPGLGSAPQSPDFEQQVAQLLAPIAGSLKGQILGFHPQVGGVVVILSDWMDASKVKKALASMGKVKTEIQAEGAQ